MSENMSMATLRDNTDGNNFIVDLTTATDQYTSLKATTPMEKAQLYAAMNNPEKRLADMINMTINIRDLYCEVVNCTNEATGEVTACPRIVVIDDKGVSYQAVSLGIFGALKKLISIFGEPTWNPPLPMTVKQLSKGEKKFLTLDIDTKSFK